MYTCKGSPDTLEYHSILQVNESSTLALLKDKVRQEVLGGRQGSLRVRELKSNWMQGKVYRHDAQGLAKQNLKRQT